MAKHKFEENYTDKKGKKWAKRCKTCYTRWMTKPKTNECKGKPDFGSGSDKPRKDPKSPRTPRQQDPPKPVAQLFGEAFRIITQNPPHEATPMLNKYLKNRNPNRPKKWVTKDD